MATLAQARCFNHFQREAAARCPSCGRFYCRECVSEHEGRMLCAACLAARRDAAAPVRTAWGERVTRGAQLLVAVAALWLAFALAGQLLLTAPSTFHPNVAYEEDFVAPEPLDP